MSAESSPLTHTITLPSQVGEPVRVVAGPGLTDSEFRNAIDSSLFKQWLTNLQRETGILANGAMTLKQVLIQGIDMFGKRVGFLKFKADIFDKETGQKVPVFEINLWYILLEQLDHPKQKYITILEICFKSIRSHYIM